MTDNDDDKELALQLHRELNALGKRRRRGDESKSQTASDQSDRDSDDDSSDDSQGMVLGHSAVYLITTIRSCDIMYMCGVLTDKLKHAAVCESPLTKQRISHLIPVFFY